MAKFAATTDIKGDGPHSESLQVPPAVVEVPSGADGVALRPDSVVVHGQRMGSADAIHFCQQNGVVFRLRHQEPPVERHVHVAEEFVQRLAALEKEQPYC